MAEWMILLVWQRLRRVERQILGMLARFQSGRLKMCSEVRLPRVSVRRPGAGLALPRRFGWLLPLVPHQAANFAGQIGTLLAEPEMAALLAAAPQARRVLGPVCRMLGVVMVPRESKRSVVLSQDRKQKTSIRPSTLFPDRRVSRMKVFWFFFTKKNRYASLL